MAASGFAHRKWSVPTLLHDPANPKPTTLALVHAAAVLSMRDRKVGTKKVLSIDMRPLVLHLLEGLQRAGIERVVVTLGDNAEQMERAVVGAGLSIIINVRCGALEREIGSPKAARNEPRPIPLLTLKP